MKDVATLACVGLATVSRVVGGDSRVSRAKTRAVQKAILELGYRRNDSARTLRTGATASIGLLIENIVDPFFSQLNQAVEDVVLERDWLLLAASSNRDPVRMKKMVLAFCARRVDGIIVTPSDTDDTAWLQAEMDAGVAMVFVDRPPHGINADLVVADNAGGAHDGVKHLISYGHQRIACFTDRVELYTASERMAGYRKALEDAGLDFDPALVYSATPTEAAFEGPLQAMLAGPNPPTAVFTGNNLSTVTVLRILARDGKRLAMVGFDDFELADVLTPGLSVIAQDPVAMGRAAAGLLFDRMAGDASAAKTVTLHTALHARGSGEIVRG